jgi:hypothetical protein
MVEREDLFTPVHKGLRAMLYDLSRRLQNNDFADVTATNAVVADLENDFAVARSAGCLLCTLHHHAEDEEGQVFPAVAKAGNGLVPALIEEHHELTRREEALARSAHAIVALASAEERVAAGKRLNQEANALFALYISHMNREEVDLVPLMARQFTDPQLAAMRQALLRSMPPERLFAILGWMLPALNVTELTDLIREVQAAPPPLVRAVSDLCAARVDPARWGEAKQRVGI